jgi:hypothetical protein
MDFLNLKVFHVNALQLYSIAVSVSSSIFYRFSVSHLVCVDIPSHLGSSKVVGVPGVRVSYVEFYRSGSDSDYFFKFCWFFSFASSLVRSK